MLVYLDNRKCCYIFVGMKDNIDKKELLESVISDYLEERSKLEKDIEVCDANLRRIKDILDTCYKSSERVIRLKDVESNGFTYHRKPDNGDFVGCFSYSFFLDEYLDLNGCELVIKD